MILEFATARAEGRARTSACGVRAAKQTKRQFGHCSHELNSKRLAVRVHGDVNHVAQEERLAACTVQRVQTRPRRSQGASTCICHYTRSSRGGLRLRKRFNLIVDSRPSSHDSVAAPCRPCRCRFLARAFFPAMCGRGCALSPSMSTCFGAAARGPVLLSFPPST